MRILDEDNDQAIKNVLLMRTEEEATFLRDGITNALETTSRGYHEHIDDVDYQHEITFAIYSDDNKSTFHERIQRLIAEDS